MQVILSTHEMTVLFRQVNGQGGFQSLLRRLRRKVDRQSGTIKLSAIDREQIPRYAFDYGNGGWENRLREIFGDHLGPTLGR